MMSTVVTNLEVEARRTWNSDARVRAEFRTFDVYFAWRRVESSGRGRICNASAATLARQAAAPDPNPQLDREADGPMFEEAARRNWNSSGQLQTEFGDFGAYLPYAKAEAKGWVKLWGPPTRAAA